MDFEWNESKRLENVRKHRIDFVDVVEMFALPMLTTPELRHRSDEDRWVGIGFLRGRIVVVVYTYGERDKVRIISARRALKHEEEKYADYVADRLGPS